MSDPVIILGGFLVSSVETNPAISSGVAILDKKIVATGHNDRLLKEYPNARIVDKRDSLVMPGFVNAHHHMYGVLSHGMSLKNVPEDLWPFLNDYWWPCVEDALNHENIRASTDWACYEMINNGYTSFYDCLEGTLAIPGALSVEAEAVKSWGLRGILSYEATERRSLSNGQAGLKENVDFIKAHNHSESLVKGMMCFHTTFTCSREFIEQAVNLAKELETRVHMHTSEGVYEPDWCLQKYGKRTVEVYEDWGVLGSHTLASQCVQLTPHEIQLLSEAGAHISHMPLSNCEVGAGFALVPEMLSMGIPVSLGTDGYINDPFQLMRSAMLLPKARLLDATVTTPESAFQMATEFGAQCLGLKSVGKLEPGWAADLVIMNPSLPTKITAQNLFEQIVLWGNTNAVTDVMVAGRWLKKQGEVLNADQHALRAKCQEAANALWANCEA